MNNPEIFNQNILNQITSEIVVLDKDLKVVWVNDSAITNNWKISDEHTDINSQFSFQTNAELKQLIDDCIDTGNTIIKRDFKLERDNEKYRIVDLTVNWSESDQLLILEVLCVDNLHKIIDSSKVFSTQKIAANLARTLAHEVKNPLGGIRGAAQLLERALPTKDLKEYTNIIISESDRLRDLVDRMLGPWQPMQFAPVNLIEIIERVMQILQGEFLTNLEWSRDYDPSLPEVHGNQDQLIQAILNVARNACQALQGTERARITFKTRVVRQFTIGSVRHKQAMHLSVIDNGPGVPEDLIERIFFPMISGRAEGSGLGLSISQNIIGQHGGALQVASRPGNTVFSVYLPFNQSTQPSA